MPRISLLALSLAMFWSAPVNAALPATVPDTPMSGTTLARQVANATARIKSALATMDAAKTAAVRRYDATDGKFLVQDIADKSAAVQSALPGSQARMDALSALIQDQWKLEYRHQMAIENDPAVAAATEAVARAHAEREAIRRQVDSLVR